MARRSGAAALLAAATAALLLAVLLSTPAGAQSATTNFPSPKPFADLAEGLASSLPSSFLAVTAPNPTNGETLEPALLFTAFNSSLNNTYPTLGRELHITFGVPELTYVLHDVAPGNASSSPVWLTYNSNAAGTGDGRVYFAATDGLLVKTVEAVDPSTGVPTNLTIPLMAIFSTNMSVAPGSLVRENSRDMSYADPGLIACGGHIFFAGGDNNAPTPAEWPGIELLWLNATSDSGTGDTLLDINPGNASSFPQDFACSQDRYLVFRCTTAGRGSEICIVDATALAGADTAVTFAEVVPGAAGSSATSVTAVTGAAADLVFLRATNAAGRRELYALAPSTGALTPLTDNPAALSGLGTQPQNLYWSALSQTLWFAGQLDNAAGIELCTCVAPFDGAASCAMRADINAGASDSLPGSFYELQRLAQTQGSAAPVLIFTAYTNQLGREAWRIADTAPRSGPLQPTVFLDAVPGVGSGLVLEPEWYEVGTQGRFYFAAFSAVSITTLWISDPNNGTAAFNIRTGRDTAASNFAQISLNQRLLFTAAGQLGLELWEIEQPDAVSQCGNLVCEIFEGCLTCPVDCAQCDFLTQDSYVDKRAANSVLGRGDLLQLDYRKVKQSGNTTVTDNQQIWLLFDISELVVASRLGIDITADNDVFLELTCNASHSGRVHVQALPDAANWNEASLTYAADSQRCRDGPTSQRFRKRLPSIKAGAADPVDNGNGTLVFPGAAVGNWRMRVSSLVTRALRNRISTGALALCIRSSDNDAQISCLSREYALAQNNMTLQARLTFAPKQPADKQPAYVVPLVATLVSVFGCCCLVLLVIALLVAVGFASFHFGQRHGRKRHQRKLLRNAYGGTGGSGAGGIAGAEAGEMQAAGNLLVDFSELKFIKQLGRGASGEVYSAKWRGTTVAVKKLSGGSLTQHEFLQEVQSHARLQHPGIVRLLGFCLEPDLCMLLELMPGGSLDAVLRNKKLYKPPPPVSPQLVDYLHQIAAAVLYLHRFAPPILHRDLKPANVLVAADGSLRVADFGLARFVDQDTMTACGSPAYAAPEVLQHVRYSESADIYSYGITMWELYTAKTPWADISATQVIVAVIGGQRPPIPDSMPAWYSELMQRCWHADPSRRPAADDIIRELEAHSGGDSAAARVQVDDAGGSEDDVASAASSAPSSSSSSSSSSAGSE